MDRYVKKHKLLVLMLIVTNNGPLAPYVEYFEKFIDEIEEETKKIQREERMEQRQEQGKVEGYCHLILCRKGFGFLVYLKFTSLILYEFLISL